VEEACKGKAEGVVRKLLDWPEAVMRRVKSSTKSVDRPCAMFGECVVRAVLYNHIGAAKPILVVGVRVGWVGMRIGCGNPLGTPVGKLGRDTFGVLYGYVKLAVDVEVTTLPSIDPRLACSFVLCLVWWRSVQPRAW